MPRGTKDPASRQAQAVAEQIRREMGAQRMSGRKLAEAIGKGETYVRERVSGAKALDLNDLDDMAQALGLDVIVLLQQAESAEAQKPATVVNLSDYRGDLDVSATPQTDEEIPTLSPAEVDEITKAGKLAALDREGIEAEQESDSHP